MEFRKIDDRRFQCLLLQEDLEDNNISLDDFFRNDTAKIHSLLDVVLAKAEKDLGVEMSGHMMSLQLSPQPDHSLLLTISSGQEDFGEMLRQAGERAASALTGMNNVIKNYEDSNGKLKEANFKQIEGNDKPAIKADIETDVPDEIMCEFSNMEDFELYCGQCKKTWGINNSLFKDEESGKIFLYMSRGRCSKIRFEQFSGDLAEYGNVYACTEQRKAFVEEHYVTLIIDNAVNIVKKYL